MKRALRVFALALAVLSLALWAALGAHRGWTRTTETRWEKDPVTELEGPVHVRKFVPGVDLLAISLLGAAVLFGGSFLARKHSRNYDETHSTAHGH